jgi:hypothetical protein
VELQTFIQDALVQIASGVVGANKEMRKSEMAKYTNSPFRLHSNLGDNAKRHPGVDFDVAVSVESGRTTEGAGKIAVMDIVKIGGGAESSNSQSVQHRIKFSVGLHQDVN